MTCLRINDILCEEFYKNKNLSYNYYLINQWKYESIIKVCNMCRDYTFHGENIKSFERYLNQNYLTEISKEKYNDLFIKYNKHTLSNKLSNKVIDFCEQWKIKIEFKNEKEYNKIFVNCLCNLSDMNNVDKLIKNKNLRFFENPFYYIGIDLFENKIIIKNSNLNSNNEILRKREHNKSIDGRFVDNNFVLLHELTHMLMRIIPYEIWEFGSPFYALSLMFHWHLDLRMYTDNLDKMNTIINFLPKEIKNNGMNNIDNYINYHSKSLINAGLLTDNLDFTYDFSKVIPQKEWYHLSGFYEKRYENTKIY